MIDPSRLPPSPRRTPALRNSPTILSNHQPGSLMALQHITHLHIPSARPVDLAPQHLSACRSLHSPLHTLRNPPTASQMSILNPEYMVTQVHNMVFKTASTVRMSPTAHLNHQSVLPTPCHPRARHRAMGRAMGQAMGRAMDRAAGTAQDRVAKTRVPSMAASTSQTDLAPLDLAATASLPPPIFLNAPRSAWTTSVWRL